MLKQETIIICLPSKKLEPQPCELCGKKDDGVKLHVGGLFTWIHLECAEIADKAIARYRRSLALGEVAYLVDELAEILKDEGTET